MKIFLFLNIAYGLENPPFLFFVLHFDFEGTDIKQRVMLMPDGTLLSVFALE